MRLAFPTQELAQSFADSVHARMIVQSAPYAASVKSGHTERWAIPYQGNGSWYVNLKQRADRVLAAQERLALVDYGPSR